MKHYEDYQKYAKVLAHEKQTVIVYRDIGDQISFTPYIYNNCSASCAFCSEKLVRNGKRMICEEICADYEERLSKVFERLKTEKVFLSLSGKEPSESPDLLETILHCAGKFEAAGGCITEKVLYSNLSGFCKQKDRLVQMLCNAKTDRIECSRHHYDEAVNQRIVHFRENEAIQYNETFLKVVKALMPLFSVKMVCVLQKQGISCVEEIIRYLEFARGAGVSEVVFRELAMFDASVDSGAAADYIVSNRVELMDILKKLDDAQFADLKIVQGYYYYSFQYNYMGLRVSFEMSDYEEMHRKHQGDKLYKLIFYPNGKLCTDWNMNGEIWA